MTWSVSLLHSIYPIINYSLLISTLREQVSISVVILLGHYYYPDMIVLIASETITIIMNTTL